MARAVWEINEAVISDNFERAGSFWSKTELAFCIEILAFSHQQSTLALALGLLSEWPSQSIAIPHFQELLSLLEHFGGRKEEGPSRHDKLAVVLEEIERCEFSVRKSMSGPEPVSKLVKSPETEDEVEPYMREIALELKKQELYAGLHELFPQVLAGHRAIEQRREHLFPVVESSVRPALRRRATSPSRLTPSS
jgi:hypothetical protein